MRQETPRTIPSIEPVISLALDHNPMLATCDISTVYVWLNSGCDIEKDILPTMQEIIKKRPARSITRFNYFTNMILEAKAKREIRQKQAAEQQSKPDSYYLEIARWKHARGLPLTTEQEALLKQADSGR